MDIIKSKIQTKTGKAGIFIGLFGVSFAAFAAGFDSCLFNIDEVDACVSHASSWIERFQGVGDHLIAWATALTKAAFS